MIRSAFVPRQGWHFLSADYSQIELRIMAHLSDDAGLLGAFADDRDVHSATAAEVFGLSSDEVTADHRRSAKAINFGLMYGMGPQRLGREFGISTKEARAFIDNYFDIYAEVRGFLEGTIEQAKTDLEKAQEAGTQVLLPFRSGDELLPRFPARRLPRPRDPQGNLGVLEDRADRRQRTSTRCLQPLRECQR